MRRKTLLAIATASAAAAITVLATGAFGGTPAKSDQPGDGVTTFVSCLASHGVQVPSQDLGDVKQWLMAKQNDPTVQAAVQACAPSDAADTGPTQAQVVTCLAQHGVDVPSDVQNDPAAFKQWVAGARTQPNVGAALNTCTGDSATNGQTK
jgi:RES domain-containing protein